MKQYIYIPVCGAMLLAAGGCAKIGEKSMSLLMVYGAAALLAMLLLAGYGMLIRQKTRWFVLLFVSVVVVNTGYLLLAVSDSVAAALWANRLSYLGSVFLPFAMLMIILQACGIRHHRCLPWMLLAISCGVFAVTASPGILDIYYQSVSIDTVNGVTVLRKVYGPWHRLYLIYLLAYFCSMIAVIAQASAQKRLTSPAQVFILLGAVLVNILVWLLEQLVSIDFEMLSISYLISELFLLGVYVLQQEHAAHTPEPAVICPPVEAVPAGSPEVSAAVHSETMPAEAGETDLFVDKEKERKKERSFSEQCAYLESQLYRLTPAERVIYDLYLDGMGTKEILVQLNITQNTLKYHNKNIYSKLGVSSRKELIAIADLLKSDT